MTAFDWLVDGAPGAQRSDEVVEQLSSRLKAEGVPVSRIVAFVRTLHPHLLGRGFVWQEGLGTGVYELSYALLRSDTFVKSPVGRVYGSGQEIRVRLDGAQALGSDELDDLRAKGFTDYLILPMRFTDGQMHAIGFCTSAPGGFSDAHFSTLRHITRPLTRLAEILALRRTATNLLNTYVGRDAGERVLAGHVQRGDVETIRCAIWFSDLRGFTTFSGKTPPADIIRTLNDIFDCQVPAVEANGGEVLKFIGDGMLAIFPIGNAPPATCAAAIAASQQAFTALDALNVGRAQPLDFGMSLHIGEVSYGNIGGPGRLDFTCIGPAVNLAARIEGLTSKLSRRLLLSEDFAQTAGISTREVGVFELKGVALPQKVFELA